MMKMRSSGRVATDLAIARACYRTATTGEDAAHWAAEVEGLENELRDIPADLSHLDHYP